MRILGMVGSLLLTLVVAGCGSSNSLESGMPEDTEFKPAPKIDFSKPKKHASKSTKAAPAAPAASGSDAMPE